MYLVRHFYTIFFTVWYNIFRLAVDNDLVSEFLEGLTLGEALEKKKIFLCDLEVLDGLECKDKRIVRITYSILKLPHRLQANA